MPSSNTRYLNNFLPEIAVDYTREELELALDMLFDSEVADENAYSPLSDFLVDMSMQHTLFLLLEANWDVDAAAQLHQKYVESNS